MNLRIKLVAVEVFATVLIIALIYKYTTESTSPYVPSLGRILETFRETWFFDHFGSDLLPSLARLVVGYCIAVVAGVSIGLAIGYSRILRLTTTPIITFLRCMPPPALLPLFIVIMGVGDGMKVAVIAFSCTWPILLNSIDGVMGIDPTIDATAKSFRIRGFARLRSVDLPAMGPRISAGMRTSLSVGLLILVVSEMVASTNGVGYFVLQSQATFDIDGMWAGVAMLGLLGYLLNAIYGITERRVLRWHLGLSGSKG